MELRDYIQPLRKWWWLIVLGAVIAAGTSYMAVRGQPSIYEASTTLLVGKAIDSTTLTSGDPYLSQQLAQTYADIAQQRSVQKGVMTVLGLTRLPAYTVQVVPQTQLIKITVQDTYPPRAQAVADELANQVIQLTPSGSEQEAQQRKVFIKAQLDDLEVKIKDTQTELTKKQADLANLFSARQISDTQAEIAALQQKLLSLQSNYGTLLSNTGTGGANTVRVIDAAELPERPVGPNRPSAILLTTVLGIILSAGTSYLLEYLDDTLKTPVDVKRQLDLTTLGAVPAMDTARAESELVMLGGGPSAAMEAYRLLRTNLQFAAVDRPLRTLLVTSPAPSEGKSLTVANLALAMAQGGRRVVVVDADLHRPRQHRLFSLPNSGGLTSALLEEHAVLDGLLQQTAVPGLRVLTSGPLPPNPVELLGSARMRDLLAELAAQADVVILDSPPTTAVSDATILSTETDGVLLLLHSGRTRRDPAKRAVENLRQVKARIVGAVLNRVPARGGSYYYYYSHYGQYYGSNNGRGKGAGGRNGKRFGRWGKRGAAAQGTGEESLPEAREPRN